MKLIDLWNSKETPTISFELFPARTEKGNVKLLLVIDELAELGPDFVSVTFGAGGSTRSGSRQLLEILKIKKELDVLAYFACYGLGPDEISEILDDYRALGIENVLTVRGDKPNDKDFHSHPESMPHATDLVAYVRPRYDFCLGVAGYPEGHIEAANPEDDLAYLKMKIDLGAEYIITNYFYDNKYFFDFVDRCRVAEITVPIIPGIMPIYSLKMMKMLAGMCGATIVNDIQQGISTLPEGDTAALIDFGIEYAFRQCAGLIDSGVPGLHIYTMDRSQSAIGLVKLLREGNLI